ncbi:CBS domain protein [Kribbella voronezhensis]|uniref:CBS domain protein n=1 Tax=Kribbella voronezhensis TaxID=2512212 RepID=A0A4R7SZ57_9ACTN|nr:CBS domain-containing protein [Kribbella voronezhensis]TDU83827.1 CBS domain protein [Kribbella voronezhensis]
MIEPETAGDVMHTDLIAVRRETPLDEVARRMAALDLEVVPVVDGNGRLVGFLTMADLAVLTLERARSPQLPGGHYLG